ncbi:MAG: 16S rRNA (guanine(966)-N(2))-methyltransferase RsmD [Eubacteriales bacterium]|nr:16S rRNA (guanine(966)-N(2))-methyltransferase RsmD [Eubacteriales bacterium]
MRIITGVLRGRRFDGPPGMTTRPTSDQVREALFNILFDRVEGSRVLDGFAGSGALSFEALSRGAAHCTLVDADRAAQAQIHKNIAHLGVEAETTLLCGDILALGNRLNQQFDLIFYDPPYRAGLMDAVMALTAQRKLLSPEGLVACEHGIREELPERYGALVRFDKRRYGSSALSFYRPAQEDAP